MRQMIDKLCRGQDLDDELVIQAFSDLVEGKVSEIELTAMLIGLKAKGESAAEIAAAARAVRAASIPFPVGDLATADTCGTGGDGSHTINISTAVAIVAAEGGLSIAKHGNRSVSSNSGSADVLEKLGVRIDASPAESLHCLQKTGLCFLFAPQYHPGIRHAMPVRRALGVRTIFNVLGPLLNPARPCWQILGVYDPSLCGPLARTLQMLGTKSALVVSGGGLDEIALHGPTQAAFWDGERVNKIEITPEMAGLKRVPIDALRGGEPAQNAQALKAILQGKSPEAHSHVVAINAGALFWITGKAKNLKTGVEQALAIIASGKASDRLELWKQWSHHGA